MDSVSFNGSKLGLVLLAVLFLLHAVVYLGPIQSDGCVEMTLAENLYNGHGLSLPGTADTHFPPVIPLTILPFLVLFGFGSIGIHTAQLFYLALAAYLAYRLAEKVSPGTGVYLSAFVLLDPVQWGSSFGATSEPVLLSLLLATVYFFVLSRKSSAYLIPTAFLASLTYLTKASALVLAAAASLGFLLWAWKYSPALLHGRGLTHTLVAALAFLLPVSVWSVRNYFALGTVDTNTYTSSSFLSIATYPLLFLREVLIYSAVYALWAAVIILPFAALGGGTFRRMRALVRDLFRGDGAALGVPYLILLLLAVLVGSALISYEPGIYLNPYFSVQHFRYAAAGNTILLAYLLKSSDRRIWFKASAAVAAVFLILTPPVVIGECAFTREYSDMTLYLDENNITEVWTDAWPDIHYNIPGVVAHSYALLDDVPDNATVISTHAVDNGPSRHFWRFTITLRLKRPSPVSNLTVEAVGAGAYATAILMWGPPSDDDIDHYLVLWSEGNVSSAAQYQYVRTVLAPTVTLSRLDAGHTYSFGVLAVDGHGNSGGMVTRTVLV